MAAIDTGLFPSANISVDTGEAMPVTSWLNALRASQKADYDFQQQQLADQQKRLADQQAAEKANFLRQAYQQSYDPTTGQVNYNKLTGMVAASPYAAEIQNLLTQGTTAQKGRAEAQKSEFEATAAHAQEVDRLLSEVTRFQNAGQAQAKLGSLFSEGKIDQATYDNWSNVLASNPYEVAQPMMLNALGSIKERIDAQMPKTQERTDGQYKWEVYSNPNLPNYGQEVPNSRIKQKLTPAQIEDQRQFNVTQERLTKEAEAKTNAPTDSSPKIGQEFLKSINWKADEKGGESDDVSALIKKSTSGGFETLGANAMRFFDKTTEGMKALNTLKTRAADLTLKLLGGKLGSGVSNADREFMQQKTADIGNSNKTAEERLSAWNDLVNRMKVIAGVAPVAPMPGGAGVGAGAGASVSPNIQSLLDKYNK